MDKAPQNLIAACYDHLSGVAGDQLTKRLLELGWITAEPAPGVTPLGWSELAVLGLPMAQLTVGGRKPVAFCQGHLGGYLGAMIRRHFREQGWLTAEQGQLILTPAGQQMLKELGVNLEVL